MQLGRGKINALRPFPRRNVSPGKICALTQLSGPAAGRDSVRATTAGRTKILAWESSAELRLQCV